MSVLEMFSVLVGEVNRSAGAQRGGREGAPGLLPKPLKSCERPRDKEIGMSQPWGQSSPGSESSVTHHHYTALPPALNVINWGTPSSELVADTKASALRLQ